MNKETKFKTPYNVTPSLGEKDFNPSETIQGQTLSISQMLKRIETGQSIPTHSYPYTEDDLPVSMNDLTDIDLFNSELKAFNAKVDAWNEAKKLRDEKETTSDT